MRILRILGAFLLGLMISTTFAAGQTWEPLTNQPTFNPGVMLLLTDGTVIMHSEPNCLTCTTTDYSSWYKLTPDSNGSYVNGTWTQIASLPSGYAPLYFGSAVLPDGRVVVEGGEYNCASGSCNAVWTNQGAIYDPRKNTWTPVQPPRGWTTIGDAQSVILPNGTYMQANCCTKQQALFNPANLTWNAVGKGKFDINDEEGWTLLPNGKVLVFSSPSRFYPPAGQFFEWNGTSLTSTTSPLSAVEDASYVGHLLVLPTGQIMFTDFTTDVEVFTPAGTYNPAWAPAVSSAPSNVTRGKTYTVSGTQFNGLSSGAAYGDDFQDATNYPLVRIVNQATGHVVYCRTHNHSTMAIATGSKKVSTSFDVPANAETGPSQLFVVANGIPSLPFSIQVR